MPESSPAEPLVRVHLLDDDMNRVAEVRMPRPDFEALDDAGWAWEDGDGELVLRARHRLDPVR